VPRRPRIGLTLELTDPMIVPVERNLREPLVAAGALVIAFPRDTPPSDIPDLLDQVDGVLISGGDDVDPRRYGEEPHPTVKAIPPAHDDFEIALARTALAEGVPILGICRGSQVLAVADGGALVQDIPSQRPAARSHMVDWPTYADAGPSEHWHTIDVEPTSRLARWIGDGPPLINSFHHQAVARTGERLRPVARAEDGIIEATESAPDAPFAAGLQWHNEFMWRRDSRWLGPFRDLVQEAGARTKSRASA
jgi:putative glutamine amidotransferase